MSEVSIDFEHPVDLMPPEELAENIGDLRWRLNNLYFIQNKSGQRTQFHFNSHQQILFENMHSRNIILKARQCGITTFIQIYALDYALFNRDKIVGVIAHTKDDASHFFDNKIKYAYDHLPKCITREESYKVFASNSQQLRFNNRSRIRVSASMRSATAQCLHISEYGYLWSKEPQKGAEVMGGALNTAHRDATVFIESTAYGADGDFYDKCCKARAHQGKLSPMDYKFFFFPWWQDPDYVLEEEYDFTIPERYQRYFTSLAKHEQIELSKPQKLWYVKKAEEQNDLMYQEFPSTPEEAFHRVQKDSIYYGWLVKAKDEDRINHLPLYSASPVNVFWDLGHNDLCCLWFHQNAISGHDHFINYYQNRGKTLDFYIADVLEKFKADYGYRYGIMYLPHDGKAKGINSLFGSAYNILTNAGYNTIAVSRTPDKSASIELSRKRFSAYKFDKAKCKIGLQALSRYRWKRDRTNGIVHKEPVHDDASHAADALQVHAAAVFGHLMNYNFNDMSGSFTYTPERKSKYSVEKIPVL